MKQAVYFVYVWPEARSSAAGIRSYELLSWLKNDGYQITALSPSKPSKYSEELEAIGVQAATCPANESAQDSFLRSLNPELVIYDRFVMEEQFGWKAREFWPLALQMIDTQDLHSVRRAREQLVKNGASWQEILALPNLSTAHSEDLVRELSALHRVDSALVVSSWEEKFLLERFSFPAEALLHLPLTGTTDPSDNGQRKGFAFLGNFRHGPNLDGIKWFIAEIWPLWRERDSSAELHLYGAYPPEQISHWKGKQGIFAHGPVQNHRDALRKHEALVAPLRYGAGIKGKILEAWGTSTPVIGTPIALEGMCEAGDESGLIFTDAESFVEAAKALPEKSEKLIAASLVLLEKKFSPEHLEKNFLSFVQSRQNNLKARGRTSVTGAMLRHAQSNASKYFSRWIEEKNKSRN